MTTHDPAVHEAIREVLVRASPDQIRRLLRDIARAGETVTPDRGQPYEH